MNQEDKRLESYYSASFHLIWTTAVVIVAALFCGQAAIALAGLAAFGMVLIVRAAISFLIIRRWHKGGVSFRYAFDIGGYAAVFQLLVGVFVIIEVVDDLATGYLSSGKFAGDVLNSPLLPIGFVLLYVAVGIGLISGALVYENKKWKVASPKDLPMLIQGAAYLIFGLAFVALYIYSQFIFYN